LLFIYCYLFVVIYLLLFIYCYLFIVIYLLLLITGAGVGPCPLSLLLEIGGKQGETLEGKDSEKN